MRRFCTVCLLGACAPTGPLETYDVAWLELDQSYALFDVKGVDWQAVGEEHRPSADADAEQLFEALTGLIAPLYDNHVTLLTPENDPWSSGSLNGRAQDQYHSSVMGMMVSDVVPRHPRVLTGSIEGYSYAWLGSVNPEPVDALIAWMPSALESGLILDLRQNRGGYGFSAEALASWFVTSDRVYARERRRNGPEHEDWEEWVDYRIAPRETRYPGPVVVLTDAYTVSGGEHLLLMLAGEGHITHIGGTTAGAFGARVWKDLPNGWVVSVTVDDVRLPDGQSLEGVGVVPDIEVPMDLSDLEAGQDPILAAAVLALTGGP